MIALLAACASLVCIAGPNDARPEDDRLFRATRTLSHGSTRPTSRASTTVYSSWSEAGTAALRATWAFPANQRRIARGATKFAKT